MKVSQDEKLDYSDVLIVPQRSKLKSRSEVNLWRRYKFPNSPLVWSGVGVIAANMDTIGTIEMAREFGKHNMLVALNKHYSEDELFDFFKERSSWDSAFYTVGTSEDDFVKLKNVKEKIKKEALPNSDIFPIFLCIDIANGYSEHFLDSLKRYRSCYPNSIIMAGNICTENMAEELIISGADICKVGIGPGSVCTTRVKTGVGYPQLSAVAECAHAVHGLKGHCCADGGITCAGDISKALAAGGDFVMIGSLIAGVDECSGEFIEGYNQSISDRAIGMIKTDYDFIKDIFMIQENMRLSDPEIRGLLLRHNVRTDIEKNKSTYIVKTEDFMSFWNNVVVRKSFIYYGMSSFEAQKNYNGGVKEHRAAEGKVVRIPAKGPVHKILLDIEGGLRSTCTYVGASKLKDLPKCAKFVKVRRTHNTNLGDNWAKS